MDEIERRVRADIAHYGWHVAKIPGDERAPSWAHSIGLLGGFDHPEIVVFGLDLETAHRLVNQVGLLVKRGRRLAHGDLSRDVLEGLPVAFRRVAPRWLGVFLGNAAWFHGREDFPALQCFWPDPAGRFPWDEGFEADLKPLQPRLDDPDVETALDPELARVLREEGAL